MERGMNMTQGTEWTEPGQGANTNQLYRALVGYTGTRENNPDFEKAWRLLTGQAYDFPFNTNLRLTGAPLNSEDVRRIGECK